MKPEPSLPQRGARNGTGYKLLFTGAICTLLILITLLIAPRLAEYRWYRDMTALTPFYDVEVTYVNVTENAVTLGGNLTKRRCVFNELVGYVYGDDGIRHRVMVDFSPETELTGVSGNRPPSDTAEAWGPWRLTIDEDRNVTPVGWEILAGHVNCPSSPTEQTNLFAKGDLLAEDGRKS
ncbi:hypothetical protein NBZ79_17480 [Sneathiella marina]|uniref:DUF1850 domain-containing protein n=1 Tax=Sneathiella marina TaxID=2950108 RepID=A0ABY4W1V1_9PROT|nr:hypothetical protein [Sneathiella marina]USG60952.1 hypothetical protein NBZ79_17480 [Sneathiella marina]